MKKNRNKKIRGIAVMIAFAIIVQVFAPALAVKAADAPYVFDNLTGVIEPQDKEKENWIPIENFPKNGKVKNLKSSNTKVVKASWNKKEPTWIVLTYKKAGKATVSFDVVYGKKTTSLKFKVTVKKYQRPCTAFKIGKKNYAAKLKGKSFYDTTYKGSPKYKISVKASKGWKLDSIYCYNSKTQKDKRIKNNTTIKLSGPKGTYTTVYAVFENKKTKDWQTVTVWLERR